MEEKTSTQPVGQEPAPAKPEQGSIPAQNPNVPVTIKPKAKSPCCVLVIIFTVVISGIILLNVIGFAVSGLNFHGDTNKPPVDYISATPTPTPTTIAYPAPQDCQQLTDPKAPRLPVSSSSPGLHKNYYPAYYNIYGWTPTQLNNQISQCGPKTDEGSFAGITTSWYSWDYQYDQKEDGTCAIKNLAIGVQVVIYYPKWVQPADAPPTTASWFQKYISGLEIHENVHKKHTLDAGQTMLNRVSAVPAQPTCGELNAQIKIAGDNVVKEVGALDKRYDDVTNHGLQQDAWKE